MRDSTNATVISVRSFSKRFGSSVAVDALDLAVPEGMIYGFLGPNGAGKTTTIRALLGFIRPSAGSTAILGHDSWSDGLAARARLGYLVPPDALYLDMSGSAQLDYTAGLSKASPVLRDRFLDALELDRRTLSRRLGTFSKGMKQKLALTAAFQTDPDVLILDEPTDGLDPLVQRNFEELLRERVTAGRTILMSSHDLAEIERVCERVAIVRDGRLVADERVEDLVRRRMRLAEIRFVGKEPAGLLDMAGVRLIDRTGDRVRVAVEGDLQPLLTFLAAEQVDDLILAPPSLEEVFFGYYGDEQTASRDPILVGETRR